MSEQVQDYALVVGVNDYPYFRSLKGPIEDARDFADWLCKEPAGGGLLRRNCEMVLSVADPPRPLQQEIDDALLRIYQRLGAARGRRLYLYFAGHGLGKQFNQVNLCLANWAEHGRRNSALDSTHYSNLIAESGKFEEIVFLLDCCRIRKVAIEGMRCSLGWPKPADLAGKSRVFIGYATEFQDSAHEAQQNGPDTVVRGYFTQALLAGLRGGAHTRPLGGVPASKLKEYLERETPLLAKRKGLSQVPQVDNGFLTGVNEPWFGTALQPVCETVIEFRAERAGAITLEDGDLNVIHRADASTGPWKFGLRRGLYQLREEQSGEKMYIRVEALGSEKHVF